MITVDLLWRQKDLYLLAPVQKSEAVHVIVQQLNRSNIHNDSFYTMTGFKFKAAANTSYKIVFSEAGKQEKMAIVKISQHIITPKSAAKKEAMHVTQQKLAYALSKLQVDFLLLRMRFRVLKRGKFWTIRFPAMCYINLQLTRTFRLYSR